jgi:DNA/RNA endonuclease YhcR with UshA esterase domain
MKEKTLLKLSLAVSLIGLLVLFFISTRIDVSDYKPQELNSNVGDDVKLKGVVTKVSNLEEVMFIELNQQNPATLVVFKDKEIPISSGDEIEVFGQVQDYKGKEQIVVQRLRVIE